MFNEEIIKVPFNTGRAIRKLDAEAFYMLSIIYYALDTASDEAIREVSGFGLSRHRKFKKQLVEEGYLTVEQIGKAKYRYIIGGLYE
jgi:hypothetical protein